MRGFAAHAVKKSLVWLSVVVFLLAGGCALRSDAPLTPGELAGRAKAVEWELVTRSGERLPQEGWPTPGSSPACSGI
ncbi:MAG: hypothetical protein AB1446_09840 [Bacillota bacterium]